MTHADLTGRTDLKRQIKAGLAAALRPVTMIAGRMRYVDFRPRRFTGMFRSHQEAMRYGETRSLAGYDHAEIAHVSFDKMCDVAPWDYPILFWLGRLMADHAGLIDAGGHMGTKYRAFRGLLDLSPAFVWTIYDVPAIVNEGRKLAERDGLGALRFTDTLATVPPTDLVLGSGLLQYLDVPVSDLLHQLPVLPKDLLLNKVAFHRQGPIYTLERIGRALVPYQMRNEATFLGELANLGYEPVDRWTIPTLAHKIDTHPEIGPSESAGFYFTRRQVG